jgi:hypothetical protein
VARSVIRELVVKILGDDASLQRAAGQSEAAIRRIGARAAEVGKALAVAGATGAVALGALVKRQINAADAATKTAQAIGVDVETLTAMQHAASLADVSNEDLAKGLARLARGSSDAAAGLQTQKAAFDALGVAVTDTDGRLRPQRELLGDVAERFAAMEDGTRKTALAQELFGRSGTQLIPLLNAGRDGLAEMTAEAERLGLVIDADTGRAAEQFNDNLTRLRGVFTGAVNQIAQRVLPILVDLSDRFVDASGKTGGFRGAIEKAEAVLRTFLTAGAVLKGVLTAVGETLGGVAAAVSLAIEGRFRAAFQALKEIPTDTLGTFRRTANDVRVVWDELGKNLESRAPAIGAQIAAPAVEARSRVQTESEKMAAKVTELVAGLEQERATVGQGADALLRYRLAKLGASEQTIAHALALQAETTALQKTATATAELVTRGQALNEEYRGAQATLLARQAELDQLITAGTISWETYARAIAEAQAAVGEAKGESQDFASTFAGVIEQAATSGKLSFRSFANSVIGQLQRILVQALVTRAVLFLIPGLGPVAAVASSIPGRQHGGPVQGGRPYVVGEAGPELFVPQAAGAIVPGGAGAALRVDLSSLPPYPRLMSPEAVAADDWWRRAFSQLQLDHADRGGR